MDLTVLFDPKPELPRLAEVLDTLGHLARIEAVRAWDKRMQAKLFEAAQGFKSVSLDDFVPSATAPLVEVVHHGKNTLGAFTHFQKRFVKPTDGAAHKDQLWGYNHQELSSLTGPGYFVTIPGETSGEVDIDYRKIPLEKAASWPAIKPNSGLVPGLVYGGMVDVMRGVSTHVTIGRAKKKGRWMDAWFVLCREDAQS